MKYKIGEKVKIKGFDWFKANEYSGQGICDVLAFLKMTDECCGKELTIDFIFIDERGAGYIMKEPKIKWRFTDSMIEGLADAPQKMVSLEKVVKYLQSKLEYSPDIDGLQIYDTSIEEFVNNFRKTMEE